MRSGVMRLDTCYYSLLCIFALVIVAVLAVKKCDKICLSEKMTGEGEGLKGIIRGSSNNYKRGKMSSEVVWVRSVSEGFVLGRILDLSSDNSVVVSTVDKWNKPVTLTVPYQNIFPAEEKTDVFHDDNCSLMYLNEATLLNNVRGRWGKNIIYSYIGNMLIGVNPYVVLPGLYDEAAINRYKGKSLGTLPPHVYAIADKSLRELRVTGESQSIIVSGESGAGKTESTKYILRFLCGNTRGGGTTANNNAGSIEDRILYANPILESFGNAKTTRNNNSSRFGKFIQIHFEKNQKVTGGFISHYLLEKSRIIGQSGVERNFHIFFQLLSGLSASEKSVLKLDKTPSYFNYLNSGCSDFFGEKLRDPVVNDQRDFVNLKGSLEKLGIETGEMFKMVAAVLHLGNIEFEDDPELTSKGGCRVTENSQGSVEIVTDLLGLEEGEFKTRLTSRVMQTAKGGVKGTVIMVQLKAYEARNARDALAKAIYSRLFDWVVSQVNKGILNDGSCIDKGTYIGVLDIAGFEYFTFNGFEQFCINYCNEKLQQFFNERVLRDEQELYEKEGLGVEKILFVDNQDCIEMIEGGGRANHITNGGISGGGISGGGISGGGGGGQKGGLLGFLDEEGKLPKPDYRHFTAEVHRALKGHFRLELARKSLIKEHRSILDDEGFIIRHFAGAVCYETKKFIDKNNDALHFSLEVLLQESGNLFLKGLFGKVDGYKGKLGYVSVAGKFKTQLHELLQKLRSTGTSFIRCIKPNSKMVPEMFEGGLILSQLQCAGMTSVLELMQGGFPSRVGFRLLYDSYSSLLPPKLSRLDPRFFCRALFKAIGLSEQDFRFGLTKVFFRPGKFKEFDQIMRTDPESLMVMVNAVSKWIIYNKWKKVAFTALSVVKLRRKIEYRRASLLVIQKTVRMHLCRKQHRHRYLGLLKLRKHEEQVKELQLTAHKLNKDRKVSEEAVKQLQDFILKQRGVIKCSSRISEDEVGKMCVEILDRTDGLMKVLSDRVVSEKNAAELEKAKKLREEMEAQKREQEKATLLKEQEIERNRMKLGLESARLSSEGSYVESKVSPEVVPLLNVEQANRDNEMAHRLASESNVTVEETVLKRSKFVTTNSAGKQFDLAGWKYSELRDTINTSCDVLLLNACREEFHRRLKVYHAWKARNSSNKTQPSLIPTGNNEEVGGEVFRGPKSLYQYVSSHGSSSTGALSTVPRYFRIPFTKEGQQKGLWYAHFEGEFIARQMEVYHGKEPLLLLAGRDDMQMCELKLSETGLTRKRGAEIIQYDFDKEWDKYHK